MHFRRLALGLALAYLFSAAPAAAAPITMTVNVTSSSVAGFTPTTFSVTFDCEAFFAGSVDYYAHISGLTKTGPALQIDGPIVTPYTSSLVSQLTGPQTLQDAYLTSEIYYYQDAGYGGTVVRGQNGIFNAFTGSDGLFHYESYFQNLYLSYSSGLSSVFAYTEADFLALLTTNTFSWSENVSVRLLTDSSRGIDAVAPIGVQYQGTATFAVTPVPEPASMALLGTGLASLAVRRFRRRKT